MRALEDYFEDQVSLYFPSNFCVEDEVNHSLCWPENIKRLEILFISSAEVAFLGQSFDGLESLLYLCYLFT